MSRSITYCWSESNSVHVDRRAARGNGDSKPTFLIVYSEVAIETTDMKTIAEA